MFSKLATKVAMKKAGISSDSFNFSWPDLNAGAKSVFGDVRNSVSGGDNDKSAWPSWMSARALPLTAQAWLTPPPPPIPVADPPKVGELTPLDRDRQLTFGGGNKVLVVFLRCVGCAFARQTFLNLRALADRYPQLTCIAVSHSSSEATRQWLSLLGGARSVRIVIDEDRAIYAAWGLGTGSFWYVMNPSSQVAGFKEKGWLGAAVAGDLQRTGSQPQPQLQRRPSSGPAGANMQSDPAAATAEGPATTIGNKWQQAGAWAVDGRGKIVWGGKALRADDVMNLDAGIMALGLL
ncbi:hypothetical protein B0T26DRAFT_632328 [Lasiosphaeria miniovina]|uniref:Alkyl hydroperoxide reductase subunit C/ Thiol specific antioxidant domain-containing protein n=1 Tax=Lasiosphaeria miniovina TaxID=1954250 RepID=A0AA40BGZ8_9PEZI|nr:uncharacterized protein B0T26DRAFT_632328 [Lasiosphaeria miniovina]KAK0733808.1 hypothetical protein B0T26DRAFT_632328 [Lasiosphaeria miniovina]